METVDIANLTTATSATSNAKSLIYDGGTLKASYLSTMLATMLVPNATVHTRIRNNTYTRAQILEYSQGETWWGIPSTTKVGDVLQIFGTTSDTNQEFVYYFLATEARGGSSTEFNGKCFLLLLEGELPRWVNPPSA